MKRGILEEQIHDQSAMNGCIDAVAGADDIFQRIFVSDHDQGSCLFFRHSAACLGQVVYSLVVADGGLGILSENPVDYGSSSGAVHISVAESDEELPDFRLEDYDQREHSHVQHHVHHGCHESHVEGRYENSDHVKRNDGHKDAHGRRSSDPSEQEEYYEAQQQDIQNICDRQLQKAEEREYHIPYILYPRKDSLLKVINKNFP